MRQPVCAVLFQVQARMLPSESLSCQPPCKLSSGAVCWSKQRKHTPNHSAWTNPCRYFLNPPSLEPHRPFFPYGDLPEPPSPSRPSLPFFLPLRKHPSRCGEPERNESWVERFCMVYNLIGRESLLPAREPGRTGHPAESFGPVEPSGMSR